MPTEDNGGVVQMPKYKCHKEVYALKIADIDGNPNTGGLILSFDEKKVNKIEVSATFVTLHKVQIGGYYIVYQDGYKSYSPAKAFEEGYKLIK